VGLFLGGLGILDVSEPTSPVFIAEYPFPKVIDVHASGDKGFVVVEGLLEETGLFVLDVSDAAVPVLEGFHKTRRPSALLVDGDVAYVLHWHSDFGYPSLVLDIVDMASTQNPVLIGEFMLALDPNLVLYGGPALAISFPYLVVSTFSWPENHVEILDISVPEVPMLLGTYSESGQHLRAQHWSYPYAVLSRSQTDGDVEDLVILDLGDPSSPVMVQEYPGFGGEVTTHEGIACIASGPKGTCIVDLNDPLDMQILGCFTPSGNAVECEFEDGVAYIADTRVGVTILDISDPKDVVLLGEELLSLWPYAGVLEGHHLITASGVMGVKVVDVQDAEEPELVGSLVTRFDAYDITVDKSTAVVCSGESDYNEFSGLEVIDVSDPTSLQTLSYYETGSPHGEVLLRDNLLYLLTFDPDFQVLDVSDPTGPSPVGAFHLSGGSKMWGHFFPSGLAVDFDKERAYWLDQTLGLVIVDVSEPENPELLGNLPDAVVGPASDKIVLSGTTAYVSALGYVKVIDVTDPHSPQPVDDIDFNNATDVALHKHDDFLFVARNDGGSGGVQLVDAGSPAVLKPLDDLILEHACFDLVAGYGYAFAMERWGGVEVFDVSGCW